MSMIKSDQGRVIREARDWANFIANQRTAAATAESNAHLAQISKASTASALAGLETAYATKNIEMFSGEMLERLDGVFHGQLLTNDLLKQNHAIAVKTNDNLSEVNRVLEQIHSTDAAQVQILERQFTVETEQLAVQLRQEQLHRLHYSQMERDREVKHLIYVQGKFLNDGEIKNDPIASCYASRLLLDLVREKYGFATKDLFDLSDKAAFDALMDCATRNRDGVDHAQKRKLDLFLKTYASHAELVANPLKMPEPELEKPLPRHPVPNAASPRTPPTSKPSAPSTPSGRMSAEDAVTIQRMLEWNASIASELTERSNQVDRERKADSSNPNRFATFMVIIGILIFFVLGLADWSYSVVWAVSWTCFAFLLLFLRFISRKFITDVLSSEIAERGEELLRGLQDRFGLVGWDQAREAIDNWKRYRTALKEYDHVRRQSMAESQAYDHRQRVIAENSSIEQQNKLINQCNEMIVSKSTREWEDQQMQKQVLLGALKDDINKFLEEHALMQRFFPKV